MEEYPTSATIPFPYGKPYPQQADLMDTILKSLQKLETTPEALNSNQHNNTNVTIQKKKAHVILIESPTGTGKSLSLACASLAWLRYKERIDLSCISTYDDDNNNNNNKDRLEISSGNIIDTTNKTLHTSHPIHNDDNNNEQSSKYDWVDSWKPINEIIETQNRLHQTNECKQYAQQTRLRLENQLNTIRRRLNKKVMTLQVNEQNQQHGNRNNKLSLVEPSKIRNIRKELLQVDISNVKENEKNMFGKVNRKKSRRRGLYSKNEGNSFKDNHDFCVDTYTSDNDGNYKKDDYINDSSSLSDSEGTVIHTKPYDKKAQENITSVQDLLNGSLLDGSNYYSTLRNKAKLHSKAVTTTTLTSQNTKYTIGNVEAGSGVRKIIYAARTHSQLSQFINELRRTQWGDNIRIITLAGRKLLCSNREVMGSSRDKQSEATVTEKCLDMQKGLPLNGAATMPTSNEESMSSQLDTPQKNKRKTKVNSNCSCPLLSSEDAISTLAIHALSHPSDIEDLALFGSSTNTCAYYASRESLGAAEVVVIPYNTLLSKPARSSLNLSLKESLVVIDEAHNIPEALRSLSSCKLTLPIIQGAISQLTLYTQKYSNRLAGKNLFYLGQIRRFLTVSEKYLQPSQQPAKTVCGSNDNCYDGREIVTANELLFKMKLDTLNIFNILRYLDKSRLSQKLHGFVNADLQQQQQSSSSGDYQDHDNFISKHISSMSIVENFLKCLTGTNRDGRIVVERPDANIDNDISQASTQTLPHFRYLLLNPSSQFQDVLDEAHAVILAGGTLRPFSFVATEILGSIDDRFVREAIEAEKACESNKNELSTVVHASSLTTFTCSHVVPTSHVFMTGMGVGPSQVSLDFRHSSRKSDVVCEELGKCVIALCGVVPAGVVVFMPSYAYEAYVANNWRQTGILDEIEKKKKFYREPKEARDVEKVLKSYGRDACSSRGAILFCVIGGKMSEGINFADDMARCVLIVGLPYPDITDPELKEKMRLLDKDFTDKKSSISGQSYYHNLCMRAVNQSIGRAIRHAKDYAAIILADKRYMSDLRVRQGLPHWLRSNNSWDASTSYCFDEIISKLQDFYGQLRRDYRA